MTTITETEIHPFEKAGLGKAPFTYVGMQDQDIRYGERVVKEFDNGVVMTTKPGGSCDYCGTYILDMYRIRSSDGNNFKVGCECVNKCCGPKLVAAVNSADKKAKKDRARFNQRLRIADAFNRLWETAVIEKLTATPHPKGWEGKTLLDYVKWMSNNAGHTGRLEAARLIESTLAG